MSIRLAVFDLGGTIVDKYSLSPFISLKHAFKNKGIKIPNKLIFKDMGKSKLEHINDILNDKDINKIWFDKYGYVPNKNSSEEIFNEFNNYQIKEGVKQVDILPETKECIDFLKTDNIHIGVTTGFNKPIMSAIREKLINNDIIIDKYVSSTCLGMPGRPEPHMINEIMNSFNIINPNNVIKVDDTGVGIQEGKNAGCITIGVAKWSTNMKMKSYEEGNTISKEEYVEKLKESRNILSDANPDYVINSLNEIPNIIKHINEI